MRKKRVIYFAFWVVFLAYLFSINSILLSGHKRPALVTGGISELKKKPITSAIDNSYPMNDLLENVYFSGWAFSSTENEYADRRMGVVLTDKNQNSYLCTTDTFIDRPDVYALSTIEGYTLSGVAHGFALTFSTLNITDGAYQISIYCYENEECYGVDISPLQLIKNGSDITFEPVKTEKVRDVIISDVTADAIVFVDIHETNADNVSILGWACVNGKDPIDQRVLVQLVYQDGTSALFDADQHNRPDVAGGYKVSIPISELDSAEYEIVILIQDEDGIHTSPNMLETAEYAIKPKAVMDSDETSGGIMELIAIPLNTLMRLCHRWTGSYILAIIVFTLLTKIILFPVSMWTNRNGLKMVSVTPALNRMKVKYYGDKDTIAEETQSIYKEAGYHPLLSTVPLFIQIVLLIGVIGAVRMLLSGTDSILSILPSERRGLTLLMPVAAGLSALILGLAQNRLNPLQREQTKRSQWGTNGLSIAISLFLGAFVPMGVGLYWICSNLFTILQQLVLNKVMPPEKYVDYAELSASRDELKELDSLKSKVSDEDKRRERADYKRFFSVVNKHLVFYAESGGFYKYFKGYIEYILRNTNLTIHYITSDPKDRIFEKAESEPRIRAYYIGENRLITLMMKMDADVVVMTMPDLENYHIKRSYVRSDIEYIFVQHDMNNHAMLMRKGCTDHFDTIFLAGKHQKAEELEFEKVYGLKPRTLVEVGYPLIDEMRAGYRKTVHTMDETTKILIAPSWQKDNIVDSCLEQLLDELAGKGYEVIVRPHPQEVRLKREYMNALKKKYESSGIEVQTDFSSNSPVMEADLLITDWSGISWEYAFTTLRPVLFINTPMKIMNPDYEEIQVESINLSLRNQLGRSLELDQLDQTAETVAALLADKEIYCRQIDELAHEYLYHLDASARVGGKYIVQAILRKISEKKERNE